MQIKILHVPFTYYPDPCGGTEVYVAALCRELRETGIENVVAAPTSGSHAAYDFENVPVHRFPIHPSPTLEMLYGEGDPVAAENFAHILDLTAPDLVHFHAISPAISHLCVTETQRRKLPTILTYHTPTLTCVRGTLMRWGKTVCDGVMRPLTCSACAMQGKGVPRLLAPVIALSSGVAARHPAMIDWMPGRIGTLARFSSLVHLSIASARHWLDSMRFIIALCDWSRELLVANGVSSEKIRTIRHGVNAIRNLPELCLIPNDLPIRVVFFGRLDPTKGIHLLLKAWAMMPDAPLHLDVYAIPQTSGSDPMLDMLVNSARGDPRIRFKSPVPPSEVQPLMRQYHALAVPSTWLETGPLVVLEALSSGIPVIGSLLGGIAEWIDHDRNGLLVDHSNAKAWRDALLRLIHEPGLLPRLRNGISPPRTMANVAHEVLSVYRETLHLEPKIY